MGIPIELSMSERERTGRNGLQIESASKLERSFLEQLFG
jgi:hypothetical protein